MKENKNNLKINKLKLDFTGEFNYNYYIIVL